MSKVVVFAAWLITGVILFSAPPRVQALPETKSDSVTLTGKVSCSKCQGIQPLHKGYSRWTWALHSVNEGDDIVLVVGDNTYRLQGEKGQLLKYMESRAKVTGSLDGQTFAVRAVTSPDRK